MITKYLQRATIATPTAYILDANQLALCLGESSADDHTFTTASYQDAYGNLYAVCSTVAKPIFASMAIQKLKAPQQAQDVDLVAAKRAQVILRINDSTASFNVIAVILGDRLESAQDHIAALGLTQADQEITDTGGF